MSTFSPCVRIGICGSDPEARRQGRGWGIWPIGYGAALTAAGAEPVFLGLPGEDDWSERCRDLQGVVLAAGPRQEPGRLAAEERLCQWCRDREFPLLAIDHGLHVLNTTF